MNNLQVILDGSCLSPRSVILYRYLRIWNLDKELIQSLVLLPLNTWCKINDHWPLSAAFASAHARCSLLLIHLSIRFNIAELIINIRIFSFVPFYLFITSTIHCGWLSAVSDCNRYHTQPTTFMTLNDLRKMDFGKNRRSSSLSTYSPFLRPLVEPETLL